jgi:hypothetical protein
MGGGSGNPSSPASAGNPPADEVDSVGQITPVSPPVPPARAPMSELELSGVNLLKITLFTIAGAALVLAGAAIVDDFALRVTSAAPNAAASLALGPAPERVQALADAFTATADGAPWPADGVADAQALLRDLAGGDLLPGAQRKLLSLCLPATLPATPDRQNVLRLCATSLELARDRSLARLRAEESQVLELQKLQNQARDSAHGFWLQIAQVILATVLLPIASTLLTNLFVTRERNREE